LAINIGLSGEGRRFNVFVICLPIQFTITYIRILLRSIVCVGTKVCINIYSKHHAYNKQQPSVQIASATRVSAAGGAVLWPMGSSAWAGTWLLPILIL